MSTPGPIEPKEPSPGKKMSAAPALDSLELSASLHALVSQGVMLGVLVAGRSAGCEPDRKTPIHWPQT